MDKQALQVRLAALRAEYPYKELDFLKDVKRGVIHIGANSGQERDLYAEYDLPVVWVEPIPRVFERLLQNLADYPEQRAYRRLITDQDGVNYAFHVANNDAMSSSILPMALHRKAWPDIRSMRTIQVWSITLRTFMAEEDLDPNAYDTLVVDVEGAELLVFRGAGDLLHGFDFIMAEAADFEAYEGGCLLSDLDKYLGGYGFRRVSTIPFLDKPEIGRMSNVLYTK